ncbi:hypothetical protein [Dyadobacter crusticola]|uniref:hypothetical protein n=1 Tax=Dyadobacter crusticola TaxID=292407 RepID=UPI001E5ED6DE|nr:hypothetical protein [Dyadobacter crusticola]
MLLLSTVSEFFRRRAGTFLVLVGVLFGFLSGAEHYAFAVFFLTGNYGMHFLFLIWLWYTLVCAQFVNQLWQQPDYTFIYSARIWPGAVRARRLFVLALGFLQPILYYGIYLTSIAIQEKVPGRVWPVFPMYGILAISLVAVAEWRLRHPVLYVKRKNPGLFSIPFPRPASWLYWIFEWLFRERGITLLAGKTGAILVATGTMLYYSTDNYDLRLPAIGLSLAYLLNFGISMELYQWENEVCLWEKSMPVPDLRRFARVVGFHAIVILPETLIAMRNAALSPAELLQLFLLGVSILTVSHLYLYKKQSQPDDHLKVFLFGFVALTLLILYKIPLLILAAAGMLFSTWFFSKWYKT